MHNPYCDITLVLQALEHVEYVSIANSILTSCVLPVPQSMVHWSVQMTEILVEQNPMRAMIEAFRCFQFPEGGSSQNSAFRRKAIDNRKDLLIGPSLLYDAAYSRRYRIQGST